MKKYVQLVANKLGYKVLKKENDNSIEKNKSNDRIYKNVVSMSIDMKEKINILIAGANDGKTNDPLYNIIKKNKEKTNVVLVEPQKDVAESLKENYSYHPSHEVFERAIGSKKGKEKLYRLKKKYWDEIEVSYGDEWTMERIATGVATQRKKVIANWIEESTDLRGPIDNKIETIEQKVTSPKNIIEKSRCIDSVDILQVDTEGLDDKIVKLFVKDKVYPSIVNIETKHIKDRKEKYKHTMEDEGYSNYEYTYGELLSLKTK